MPEREGWLVFRVPAGTTTARWQYWALPLTAIMEVLQGPKIFPIPRVPDVLQGCFWYRGRILSVVDMARLLGKKAWQGGEKMVYYYAVLMADQSPLALDLGAWVLPVHDDMWIPVDDATKFPSLAMKVQGCLLHERIRPVFLLDISAMIQHLDELMMTFVRDEFTFQITS